MDRIDWALFASDAGARALDTISTRRALQCTCNHESVLPGFISHDTASLSAFEAGVWGVEYLSAKALRRRHPILARLIPAVDAASVGWTAAHNLTLRTESGTGVPTGAHKTTLQARQR